MALTVVAGVGLTEKYNENLYNGIVLNQVYISFLVKTKKVSFVQF